jgi:thiamine-monophosphate kinase
MPDFAGITVAEAGEFTLIEALASALPTSVLGDAIVQTGIGDDAAVWMPRPGAVSVVTTDSLIEGVHFRLDWTDWESLGFKMLAVNLSDIAAMGAAPRLVTVSLGLRGTEHVSDLQELYRGMGRLAAAHGVVIAGGDVVRSPERLMLGITAIGEVDADKVLRRSGAQVGDLIVVSGTLGASAGGMEILLHPERYRGLATTGLLVAAHLRPNPRLALGRLLADAGATAAMDLSDGLLGDLPKILKASGVRARIDSRLIPVAPAMRALFPDRWLDLTMRGGEDYELLVTIGENRYEALAERAQTIGATLSAIGTVEEGEPGITVIGLDGMPSHVIAGAFDHFTQATNDCGGAGEDQDVGL